MKSIRGVALSLLLILTGCQEFLSIRVEEPWTVPPKFAFYFSSGVRAEAILISSLRVTDIEGNGAKEETVWEIESSAARISSVPVSPKAIDEVTYGLAPNGFVTIVPPKPLRANTTYRVIASTKIRGRESVVGAAGEFVLRAH